MRRVRRPDPDNPRSGAALLLSVLVLIVLITIVFQIRVTTMTGARVARNDIGLTTMELAIDAAMREVFEQLKADAEAAEAEDAGGGGGGIPGGDPIGGAGAEPGGGDESEAPPASDSREDEWARPQRPEVNRITLRVLVVDENRKYNILNMLDPDEERAEEAFQRVVRILDACREDTQADIESSRADEMTRAMREYILERDRLDLPLPELLTMDEQRDTVYMPFTMREFVVLQPFDERDFRDFRDEDGAVVHSIDTFLTIFTSPGVQSDVRAQPAGSQPAGATAGAQGGGNQAGGTLGGGTQSGGTQGGDGGRNTAPASGGDGAEDASGAAATQAGQAAGAQGGSTEDAGGFGVNLNTAPPAVLKSLFDSRDVSERFWDDVIEYRNEEEEEEPGTIEEDVEPLIDEFGEEIVPRKIFDSLDELSEIQSWDGYDPETQELIRSMLTTESEVFSVYITARRGTSADEEFASLSGEQLAEEEEAGGKSLVRTVRSVIWRRPGTDGTEIVPIIPWEVVEFTPFELVDYPERQQYFSR